MDSADYRFFAVLTNGIVMFGFYFSSPNYMTSFRAILGDAVCGGSKVLKVGK